MTICSFDKLYIPLPACQQDRHRGDVCSQATQARPEARGRGHGLGPLRASAPYASRLPRKALGTARRWDANLAAICRKCCAAGVTCVCDVHGEAVLQLLEPTVLIARAQTVHHRFQKAPRQVPRRRPLPPPQQPMAAAPRILDLHLRMLSQWPQNRRSSARHRQRCRSTPRSSTAVRLHRRRGWLRRPADLQLHALHPSRGSRRLSQAHGCPARLHSRPPEAAA